MGEFLGACGAVLLSVILIGNLNGCRKDMAALLSLVVCVMVTLVALQYVRPMLDFLEELEAIGSLDSHMVRILLKLLGIGLVSEVAILVCNDSGNASLGKSLQMLTMMLMMYHAIPLYRSLIALLQEILGQL